MIDHWKFRKISYESHLEKFSRSFFICQLGVVSFSTRNNLKLQLIARHSSPQLITVLPTTLTHVTFLPNSPTAAPCKPLTKLKSYYVDSLDHFGHSIFSFSIVINSVGARRRRHGSQAFSNGKIIFLDSDSTARQLAVIWKTFARWFFVRSSIVNGNYLERDRNDTRH